MIALPTRHFTSHYREIRDQYAHVCDDCVLVVSVSDKEQFAEQKLSIAEQNGVDKRDPGRRIRRGKEGGRLEREEGWQEEEKQ